MKSNNRNEQTKEILFWAVDPTQNPDLAKNLVKELKLWAKKLDCSIQPVSVFSKKYLHFPFDVSDSAKDSLKSLDKAISTYVRKSGLTAVLSPEIIFVDESSRRKKALALAEKAASKKAKMIFASTRATSSMNPFRVGGFAEALVACSQVPVLLLNPKAIPSTKIPSILFPTDFSRDSRNALSHLVPLAKAFRAKIHLFNQLEGPTYHASEYIGYNSEEIMRWEMILKDVEAGRKRHAKAWLRKLKQQDVICDATLMHQKKSTSGDILEFAKKSGSSVIAMATRSGAVSRFFLGSTARDVLLNATCPVIICYRPFAVQKLTRASKPRREISAKQSLRQRQNPEPHIQPVFGSAKNS